jgi:hypothetical protein
MTARTGKLFVLAERVWPACERVEVIGADTGHHVFAGDLIVARIAVTFHELVQDKSAVRPVSVVAGEALSSCRLKMDVLFCYGVPVVAAEAEVRDRGNEQFREVAGMRVMA